MWVYLALIVAVLTSILDILFKHAVGRINAYVITWAWTFFSLPFLYLCLWVDGVPPIGQPFWITWISSAILLAVATIYYVKAIRSSDLSLTIPILNITPLLLLGTSSLMLNEFPTPQGVIGVLLIVFGTYRLFSLHQTKSWIVCILENRGVRYMLIVAVLFSITANLDKIGVVNSSPIFWLVMVSTVIAVILTLIIIKNWDVYIPQIKAEWKILCLIGLVNAGVLIAHMTAIEMTLVPYLIAIKRASVIMTTLYGFMFLNERGFRERFGAIVLMVIGVFLISFS